MTSQTRDHWVWPAKCALLGEGVTISQSYAWTQLVCDAILLVESCH